MNQGNEHSSQDEEGKTGLFLSCGGTLGVPLKWRPVCEGTSFLRCNKGVKDPFEAQEGKRDFSRDATMEKGLILRLGENILYFLELWLETWGSS